MQDILRNVPEDKQRQRAWIFGILLSGYVTLFMASNSASEVDTDLILGFDPILMLAIQGVVSTIMFIGVALLFARVAIRIDTREFFPKISWITLGLVTGITISFMVVNSAIGEWNMSLDFGDSDFAEWARRSEEQLKVLTEHITNFRSTSHFVLAIVVVALIPAIGEELIFRGLIQNFFVKAFGNHHVAIWVTGFIFAAIHMQFFGIAPRMMLGVVFGYLYHWSGKLTVAMAAHFINNGFALIALYLAQSDIIEVSPEEMEQSAPWSAVLIFAIACGFLINLFYKRFRQNA